MAAPASLAPVLLLLAAMAPCSSALEPTEVRSIEAQLTTVSPPPRQRVVNPALLGLLALALVVLRYFFGKRRAAASKGDAQKSLKVVPCDANQQEAPSTADVEAAEREAPVFAGAAVEEPPAAKVEEVVKLADAEPPREYEAPEAQLYDNLAQSQLYENVGEELEIPLSPEQVEAVEEPLPAPTVEDKLEEVAGNDFVRKGSDSSQNSATSATSATRVAVAGNAFVRTASNSSQRSSTSVARVVLRNSVVRMASNSSQRSATSATSATSVLTASPAYQNSPRHWRVAGGSVQVPPASASLVQMPGASVEVSPQGRSPLQRGQALPLHVQRPSTGGVAAAGGVLRSQPSWRTAPAANSPRVVAPAMTSPRMVSRLDGSTRSNRSVPGSPRNYMVAPVLTRKRTNSREFGTVSDPFAGA